MKQWQSGIIFLVFFLLPLFPQESTAEQTPAASPRKIIIHNANRSERQKDDIIRFSGAVRIAIIEEEKKSEIFADTIVYDKNRNTLYAEGNVRFTTGKGDTVDEEMRGSVFLFHVDDSKGAFLDGVVRQKPKRSGQKPFFVEGSIVGKDTSGVIGFKNARLGTGIGDDSLWSINASRIWILPGNEFAFANGYLSIGVVPVLYLPFFYYPVDEMIFHPVFGMRNREGAFIQTTTYVVGRKPAPKAEKGSSFSNFFQGDTLMEQERDGVFLKNKTTPAQNIPKDYVKLIADAYSGLGTMFGIDGSFKSLDKYSIPDLSFSFFLGFSKTLYKPSSGVLFRPLYAADGKPHWNSSNLFGAIIPLRYSAHLSLNVRKSPFSMLLQMPIISDPYFNTDFFSRGEDMNWFRYFLNKGKNDESSLSTKTSYEWKLATSILPNVSKASPWLQKIALSSLSGSLYFNSRRNKTLTGLEAAFSPERFFYVPQKLKTNITADINGTLFSTQMLNKKKPAITNTTTLSNPFLENNTGVISRENSSQTSVDTPPPDFFADLFPPLSINNINKTGSFSRAEYSFGYSGRVNFLDELNFDNTAPASPEKITWKKFSSHYFKFSGNVLLNSNLNYAQNFLTVSNSLQFSAVQQRHGWVLPGSSSLPFEKLQEHNYKASVYSLVNENRISLQPLKMFPIFAGSSLSWTIKETLLQNNFIGTYTSPQWNIDRVKWDKKFIKTHLTSLVFSAAVSGYTQRLGFSANLPPLLGSYSFSGSFTFPYGSFTISTRLFEKESPTEWKWEPVKMGLSWSLPYDIRMAQQYSYNIEEKESERLNLTFSWKYISALFLMGRENPQTLDPIKGWQRDTATKKFMPLAIGFTVSNASNPFVWRVWKNRVKFSLSFNSSLQFNLLRITESYFTFTPKLVINIHEFLDLSISIYSRNDRIARYFQDAANLPVTLPGETNVLKDLLQSFYFWDESARRASAFKLKSLDISLTHYLKDWTLEFSYSIRPTRKKNTSGRYYYDFSPVIKFAVTWKPISDIKVEAKKQDKKFTLKSGKIK